MGIQASIFFAFEVKATETFIPKILQLILLWLFKVILWPVYVILTILDRLLGELLYDYGTIKDLIETPFIMAYVSLFLLILLCFLLLKKIVKNEKQKKEESYLKREIENTERELKKIKDEIEKEERRIKVQLSDIIEG